MLQRGLAREQDVQNGCRIQTNIFSVWAGLISAKPQFYSDKDGDHDFGVDTWSTDYGDDAICGSSV
jgi:hypothetical protein